MIEGLIELPLAATLEIKRFILSDEIVEALGCLGNTIDWVTASVETRAKKQ
jgi:hypothetical protein